MRTSLLLILLVACSSSPKDKDTSLAWQGHALEETSHHPYFKNLRLLKHVRKNGLQEWTYRDMSASISEGFCEDITNCRSLASTPCDYTFKARNDKIEKMEIWGQCPYPKNVLMPKS